MEEDDEKLIDAITKQNDIDTKINGFKMRILKRQKIGEGKEKQEN